LIKRCVFTTTAALCVLCGHARAGVITPISYTYTNSTSPGEGSYIDSGTFLTDGDLGTPNVGAGGWVLWQGNGAPEITFTFGSAVTVNTVSLDMSFSTNGNTFLPESVAINGGSVSSADTIVGDPGKGFINYTGSWTGSTLVLDLGHNTNHWIGVNEVQFSSNDAGTGAPEPASFVLLGGALLALGASRYLRR
jgi:hypothetical protein